MKIKLAFFNLVIFVGLGCGRNEAEYYGYAKKTDTNQSQKIVLSNSEQISIAIQNDNWPEIQNQISNGLSINTILDSGRTLLNECVQWNRETIFKNLIALGADATLKDQTGADTLEMCSEKINFLVILNPSLLNKFQEELFNALETEDFDLLQGLLEQNLNPNFLLPSGDTPLTYSVTNNLENAVRALTNPQFKTDIHFKGQSGKTALELAKELNLKRIEKILVSRGAQH